jgi:hypothetical protein
VVFRFTLPLFAAEPHVVSRTVMGEMGSIGQRMGETAYISRDLLRRHAMSQRSLVAVEAEESLDFWCSRLWAKFSRPYAIPLL